MLTWFLAGFLALIPQGKLAGPYPILSVTDGDTLRVGPFGEAQKVRLIGIDTPEKYEGPKLNRDSRRSGRDRHELQLLGRAASRFTEHLVSGKDVWLEFDLTPRDRHGRLLAYVYYEDAAGDWQWQGKRFRQLNLEIIRAGWAVPMTIVPNVRYAELYAQAQRQAREARRGIWAELPPAARTLEPCEPLGKTCPPACPVKGNVTARGRKIYHLPNTPFYAHVIPEVCFPTEVSAQTAGFVAPGH